MKSLISPSLKSLAIGATAAATLAGFGLASAPAQAAWLMLNPSGQLGSEVPSGATASEYWKTGQKGYDNGLVTVTGKIGEVVTLDFNYLGNGSATLTNNFEWRPSLSLGKGYTGGGSDFIFTGIPSDTDWKPCSTLSTGTGCWNGNPSNSGKFLDSAWRTITLTDTTAELPFRFIANVGAGQTIIPNGSQNHPANDGPHYFAVVGSDKAPDQSYPFNVNDQCYDGTCKSDLIGLGLSDRRSELTDNDASDSNVKITIKKTPEPSAALGLLAIAGLGLVAAKRQKQS